MSLLMDLLESPADLRTVEAGVFQRLSPAERVRAWGRGSVSPFTLGVGTEIIELGSEGLAGVLVTRRTALMATDPIAAPGTEDEVLDELLAVLAKRRLRPVFASVADPEPYQRRGLFAQAIAEDPVIDLEGFSLAGKRRASVRHSVSSAGRAGLRVVPWQRTRSDGARLVSDSWLSTKRGGELGFTLGSFRPDTFERCDCRLAVDPAGQVVGLVTWHEFDNGRARVLDLMRRLPDAPNPTMDLLIAQSLIDFAANGVERVSLGSVPLSHGALAERIYPTISLRRYKQKFDPEWAPGYTVVSSALQIPAAARAVIRAYCPDGVIAATHANS